MLAVTAVVVLTLAVGFWFFLFRGDSGATSQFLAAHDRFVAAEHKVEAASGEVQRFIELEEFDDVVTGQIVVMLRQRSVFEQLAGAETDERGRLASEAAAAAARVIAAADTHWDAIAHTRRLSDAADATLEMQAGMVELNRVAAEWKKLQ